MSPSTPKARAVFAALSDEALTAFGNRGLLKRAGRMVTRATWSLREEQDTVVAVFDDTTETTLHRDRPLGAAECSCVAVGVCRHKVATALICRRVPEQHDAIAWSPADIPDEEIEATASSSVLRSAEKLRGVAVECATTETPVRARLPTCTVSFYGVNLAAAHCDCAQPGLCEHILVAIWALRAAAETERAAAPVFLASTVRSDLLAAECGPADELLHTLAAVGVVGASAGLLHQLVHVSASLQRAGYVWPTLALDDLRDQMSAYHARSAEYDPLAVLDAAVEVHARLRAARGAKAGSAFPAQHVLGSEVRLETPLETSRYQPLGARIEERSAGHTITLFLATDTGKVVTFSRTWRTPPRRPLSAWPLLPGQSVARCVTRRMTVECGKLRADGALRLSRSARVALGSPTGWRELPEVLQVADTRAWARERSAHPPMLLPRRHARDTVVITVSGVGELYDHPGAQRLYAEVYDGVGAPVWLVVPYSAATPGRQDGVVRALRTGEISAIAGQVRREGGRLVLDPIGLASDAGVCAPAIEPGGPSLMAQLPRRRPPPPESELWALLDETRDMLAAGLQRGLRHGVPAWSARLHQHADALEAAGAHALSTKVRSVLQQDDPVERRGRALLEAGLWISLYAAKLGY